jgi:hypothetical protein
MKRLIWTVSVALVGVFLASRSAPVHWEWVSLGAILGGTIGLGFGSIFTSKDTRLAALYWAVTFAAIGFVLGLEEPIGAARLARRTVYGAAIGILLGIISHLVQAHKTHSRKAAG